jgi:hypothetical protein
MLKNKKCTCACVRACLSACVLVCVCESHFTSVRPDKVVEGHEVVRPSPSLKVG